MRKRVVAGVVLAIVTSGCSDDGTSGRGEGIDASWTLKVADQNTSIPCIALQLTSSPILLGAGTAHLRALRGSDVLHSSDLPYELTKRGQSLSRIPEGNLQGLCFCEPDPA